ncbi:hypothetical protein BT93_C2443 [Corymbia citriodora subsp. variegata]|nr:hypothetical protein BT93_C2443 [Corymbia citriodora subsp. variegata]
MHYVVVVNCIVWYFRDKMVGSDHIHSEVRPLGASGSLDGSDGGEGGVERAAPPLRPHPRLRQDRAGRWPRGSGRPSLHGYRHRHHGRDINFTASPFLVGEEKNPSHGERR